jgi:hypothetical protein
MSATWTDVNSLDTPTLVTVSYAILQVRRALLFFSLMYKADSLP